MSETWVQSLPPLSPFLSCEEAQHLVKSGFARELLELAEGVSQRHYESLTEAGYAQAMREYGVPRDQVNLMWVHNEYVHYHSHGGWLEGREGAETARMITAYAAGELVTDAPDGTLIPLTQGVMEAANYPWGYAWNPAQQGEHVGRGWVPYGNFQFLGRASLVKVSEKFRLWISIGRDGLIRGACGAPARGGKHPAP